MSARKTRSKQISNGPPSRNETIDSPVPVNFFFSCVDAWASLDFSSPSSLPLWHEGDYFLCFFFTYWHRRPRSYARREETAPSSTPRFISVECFRLTRIPSITVSVLLCFNLTTPSFRIAISFSMRYTKINGFCVFDHVKLLSFIFLVRPDSISCMYVYVYNFALEDRGQGRVDGLDSSIVFVFIYSRINKSTNLIFQWCTDRSIMRMEYEIIEKLLDRLILAFTFNVNLNGAN